jgi:hypothetical protein
MSPEAADAAIGDRPGKRPALGGVGIDDDDVDRFRQ